METRNPKQETISGSGKLETQFGGVMEMGGGMVYLIFVYLILTKLLNFEDKRQLSINNLWLILL